MTMHSLVDGISVLCSLLHWGPTAKVKAIALSVLVCLFTTIPT